MKIPVNLNKDIGLASVSRVQNPDFEGFLGLQLEARTKRRTTRSRQSPFPPCQSSLSWVSFSAAARQSRPFHPGPSHTSVWPHTPWDPNLVTPRPNTLSATPKASYAPSLTFSAPICLKYNLFTSPLSSPNKESTIWKLTFPETPYSGFGRGSLGSDSRLSRRLTEGICGNVKLLMMEACLLIAIVQTVKVIKKKKLN